MATKSGSSFRVSATPVMIIAHLLGIAVTVLVLVWLLHFRGGLAFKSQNKQKIFNVHPLLMVIGFILIGGGAVMAYKTVSATRKTQKVIHLILHLITIVVGILGVYVVFKFHHEVGKPNLYTLHSWLGISTISLYGFQWLLGVFSFWYPGAEMSRRATLAPWHVFGGMVIFLMAIGTALTGLVQRFIFLGLSRSQEALIVNFSGLLILLFGITVALTVILPRGHY